MIIEAVLVLKLSSDTVSQVIRDLTPLVLGRALKLCNFLDYQDIKVLSKARVACLFV